MTPVTNPLSRIPTFALLGAIGLLAAIVGLEPVRSFDYWWHLRTGQLIAETGAVPFHDPYTYTVPGARWIDMHWAFQLGLHGLYRLGGHEAVQFAKAGCVLALVGILGSIGWRRTRVAVSALALGLMLVAARERLLERPELLSFLILAAELILLYRHERRGDHWVFAIVPLQLLWSNLHGLQAVGIAVCGMALVSELVRPLLCASQPMRRERARRLGAVVLLSFGASFVNPNGVDAALFPLQQLQMIAAGDQRSDLGSTIAELRPILEATRGSLGLLAAGGLALATLLLNWRRLWLFEILVFSAFLVLSLAAERNVALLAIVSVPIGVRNLNELIDRHPPPRWMRGAAPVAVLGLLIVAIAQMADRQPGWMAHPVTQGLYPEAAVDWIDREQPPGPLFHAMADGGYLIWRLHGAYPVMVDGRLEVFGEQAFSQLRATVSGTVQGFQRLDETYHFGVALLSHRFFPRMTLVNWLLKQPDWRLVLLDDTAALLVRSDRRGVPGS